MQIASDEKKLIMVKKFIAEHKLAVLSTVTSANLPEAAIVGFSESANFNIIFGTFSSSRKYENLMKNPSVAMVIGWDQGKTVQLEGRAEQITDPEEIKEVVRVHLGKIPSAAKFVDVLEERFFKIQPKWIRYSDWSVEPREEFEIVFPG